MVLVVVIGSPITAVSQPERGAQGASRERAGSGLAPASTGMVLVVVIGSPITAVSRPERGDTGHRVSWIRAGTGVDRHGARRGHRQSDHWHQPTGNAGHRVWIRAGTGVGRRGHRGTSGRMRFAVLAADQGPREAILRADQPQGLPAWRSRSVVVGLRPRRVTPEQQLSALPRADESRGVARLAVDGRRAQVASRRVTPCRGRSRGPKRQLRACSASQPTVP
jgi:hypothetical protein